MITVFSRNYSGGSGGGCTYSGYSALFNGSNQYAAHVAGTTNSHWPNIGTYGNPNKVIISMWVKNNDTTSQNGLKFLMGQNTGVLGGGNSNDQFFRIAYAMNSGGGAATNRLYVTYRGSTTSNAIEKQYQLHGNSAITGSVNANDQWLDGNTTGSGGNIITNVQDFVHLCVVMDLPPDGVPYNVAGNIDTYWNGQLLTTAVVNTVTGSGTPSSNGGLNGILATNAANLSGYWNGHIDELLTTEDALNGMTTTFMNSHSLASSQDIATFLWNSGCPGNTSHAQSAQWDYFTYRFENNWNSENASPYPFTAVNGPVFSTTHA